MTSPWTLTLPLPALAALLWGACQFDTAHLDQLRAQADQGGLDLDAGLNDVPGDVPGDVPLLDADTGDEPDVAIDPADDPDAEGDADATGDLPVDDTDIAEDQGGDQGDLLDDPAEEPDAVGDPDVVEEPDVIEPPNDPPVVVAPTFRRVEMNRPTRISGISVTDPDVGAADLEVTLTASQGTVSIVPVPGGIAFATGDGTADPLMVFTGGLEAVNEALGDISFVHSTPGVATLEIEVSDLGNTGSGGAGIDTEVVDIEIVERIFDFNIQRGTETIPAGQFSVTLDAGDDYDAPEGPAFVRIVNTRLTGMGQIADGAGNGRDIDEWMVYVDDSMPLSEAIRFSRFEDIQTVRVTWELIEFTGEEDSPNAIVVHATGVFRWDSGLTNSVVGDGASIDVADDADVAVFVTGQAAPDNAQGEMNRGIFTTEWDEEGSFPKFRRFESGSAARVSYAVVEFTGSNWMVQWVQRSYLAAGSVETVDLESSVGSLDRAFLHVQHRSSRGGIDELGSEVWLSDPDTVSFLLQTGAQTDTFAVAWVISNSQTTGDPMAVAHYTGTRPSDNGADEEDVWTQSITPVPALERASIWGEVARSSGGSTAVPRGSVDLRLTAVDTVELRQCDAQDDRFYRFSVVSWPDDDDE